ncbi:MAG: LysR family transcriptional regulator [Candidatus Sedimenticola endophacoides]|nr:MAG: LysR family transcriptional regulator [Candidatus Sedimenticola endophacoides]
MNLPTLRQLQYLVALVELQHFGKAAARCFVSQSTLSAGIMELENLLGARLLERTRRRVLPTPLGGEVAARARQMLGIARELVEMSRYGSEPLCGPIRLGVIPTIGPFLLPRVLPSIRHGYPGLELQITEDRSQRLLERLGEGTLDCAILAFPYPVGELEQLLFWEENFMVALPRKHPLARLKRLTTPRLESNELMLLEEGHCLTDHALSACHLERSRAWATFRGSSLYTLLQMVAGGQGITFVPEMAADSELMAPGEILLKPLDEPGPHRRIGLVWRKTYFRKEDMTLLAAAMRQTLAPRATGEAYQPT